MRILMLILMSLSSVAQADNHHSLTQLAMAYTKVIDTRAEANFPILIQESRYSFEKTLENIHRSILGSNFRLIRQQALVDGYGVHERKGQREAMVYFCNFDKVNQVLKLDKRVGQFLPCRITVVEHRGSVYVMAINPKKYGKLFHNDKLTPICNEITAMYKQVIGEATL